MGDDLKQATQTLRSNKIDYKEGEKENRRVQRSFRRRLLIKPLSQ
jgi:hypothetical protein